jgi:hypothetical protein
MLRSFPARTQKGGPKPVFSARAYGSVAEALILMQPGIVPRRARLALGRHHGQAAQMDGIGNVL